MKDNTKVRPKVKVHVCDNLCIYLRATVNPVVHLDETWTHILYDTTYL